MFSPPETLVLKCDTKKVAKTYKKVLHSIASSDIIPM